MPSSLSSSLPRLSSVISCLLSIESVKFRKKAPEILTCYVFCSSVALPERDSAQVACENIYTGIYIFNLCCGVNLLSFYVNVTLFLLPFMLLCFLGSECCSAQDAKVGCYFNMRWRKLGAVRQLRANYYFISNFNS